MKAFEQHPEQSTVYRCITAAFGLLFLAVAVVIVVISELSLGVLVAIGLVGGLGADALISAMRGKRAMLSRIGPLP